LQQGGIRSEHAVTAYLAAKVVLAVAFLAGFLWYNARRADRIEPAYLVSVVVFAAGFYLPEVWLSSRRMRDEGVPGVRLSRAEFSGMYWTLAQMLAHHASNGCNLRPGDLIASGTVSGPAKDARGCMLELTWRGAEPVTLPTGETRAFLADGDEVVLRGRCEAEGARAIGFGECRGEVVGWIDT
jgi:fumarylacetoacetase